MVTADALDVLCAVLTRDLFAIAKFLLSRRSRQRERLSASMLSICLFVCLSISLSVAKMQKTLFSPKLSNLELWSLLTTYRKSYMRFSKNPFGPSRWLRSAILKIDMTSIFSAEGCPIWIKFHRLVQNDMATAVIWSNSKPDVELKYGGRFGEFHGMSSQSHVSHCRVLPLGEFTVVIPEPHATLQGAVTWRNQCHDRATLQGLIILSAILKIVFRHVIF